jgi:hypothetical protein
MCAACRGPRTSARRTTNDSRIDRDVYLEPLAKHIEWRLKEQEFCDRFDIIGSHGDYLPRL